MHTPVGSLFLQEPPIESVPIPDFRTIAQERIGRPSPNLLETIYLCQQRQEWYHDFARSQGEERLPFVGSVRVKADVVKTASNIRETLGFGVDQGCEKPTQAGTLRCLIEQVDGLGVLVMVSGVVGSNNRRSLDPEEFRGFALVDDLAPLVFINGADTKGAQMFTLAHELAHIWLGQSAVSDTQVSHRPSHSVEGWCNQVAAELLVPLSLLHEEYDRKAELRDEVKRLAQSFKVSTLVIMRRIHEADGIGREQFWEEFNRERNRLCAMPKGHGGNFYATLAARVGKRFARSLVITTLEGQTLHRDAFHLLGISKLETFHDLGRRLGVMI